ncbi:uncharacterized protein LOC107406111 [Ziziphus jujuba]|uniref:Uncharacterized protein LOC107406111 n=1 Tax=Ziziphus jujuba TaxID=326968 RepID=A0ABM3IPQ1_ZIZJJ|nr:uncharacterized protein LOC107406111 [Ziziphus jujuba]
MEFFLNGKALRLRSQYKKYLVAKDDKKSVGQDGDGSSKRAEWTVEVVTDSDDYFIRLKRCYNKYLTASSTGQKVLQTPPSPDDSTVEWEPINDGEYYRLKRRNSSFLRGSRWRRLYSVTHYTAENETMKSSLKWDIEDVMTPPADPPFAFENVS